MKKESKIILIFILTLILIVSGIFLFVKNRNENVLDNQKNNQEEVNNQESAIQQRILDAVGKANSGDKEGALSEYFLILEDDPDNLVVLNNIADLYSDMSNWIKAEEYYKKLLEIHPDYIPGYRMLAYLYWYRFNDDEVKIKALIDDGLSKNNNHPDLLSWIINYYQEKGEEDKAIPYSNLLSN